MNQIDIWVIYKHPKDFPNKYVVRHWINENPTKTMYTANTLEEIRKKIPQGLTLLPRFPQDDPKIVEVWL